MLNTYLLVELGVGWFKLLLQVGTGVIHVLGLGKRQAWLVLLSAEMLGRWGLWHCVQWNLNVVAVSVLLQFDVAHFFVAHNGWIVRWHVSWKLGEIGSHIFYLKLIDWLRVTGV